MRNPIRDRSRSTLPIHSRPILAACVILSAFLFTGCLTEPDDPRRILTGNHYTNKDIGFDFAFPATWVAKPDQSFGDIKTDVVIVAPPRNNFSTNLNVIITPHTGPTAMQEILPLLESAVKGQTADAAGYKASIGSINGKEVGYVDYESSVSGNLVHFSMLVFINNNKDVVVTITDRAESYPTNAEVAAIKASYRIVPK